jgi:hypothetical protein
MTDHTDLEYYSVHSALTDPGSYAASIGDLPPDVPVLCRTLHGVMIHEAWVEMYGTRAALFSGQSRESAIFRFTRRAVAPHGPDELNPIRSTAAHILACGL